jgi:tetratricopeptide (TPR) repeat protein
VLEKAVEKAPQDLDLQARLARTYAQNSARDKAVAAFEALIPKLAADKQLGAKVELMELEIESQPEKARKVLETVDPATLDAEHAQKVIDLCLQAKDWDRGLDACKKGFELGLFPHFQMGMFHEKKENYIEAFRCYNRDRGGLEKDDPEAQMRKMQREMRRRTPNLRKPEKSPEEAEPENGEEARTRLLQKLGPNFLISRHLGQIFEALTAAEEKTVKDALEKLSSDESRERDSGYDAIRKIGPRATPRLQPLLESSEAEVKSRVRQLLTEWAEPR